MRTMNIVLSPDPGLRQVCEPCQVGDKSLKKLAKQMLNTMYANNGCGLAAPQVGLNKRMVVIDCYDGPNETSNPLVLINPEVVELKGEKVTLMKVVFLFLAFPFLLTRNEISLRSVLLTLMAKYASWKAMVFWAVASSMKSII